jgi:hypothetical protein
LSRIVIFVIFVAYSFVIFVIFVAYSFVIFVAFFRELRGFIHSVIFVALSA